ncbi:MAG: KpsF/GutQ family sugar-phosphate isomerase [Fimbriimonadia bacterium]|jgi:arabinose-5-phosphate isomerase
MSEVRDHGREVLRLEATAVAALADSLDDSFDRAVTAVLGCKGRVVTTGIGKAGHVAAKVAWTLTSTGTPSQFLHPTDALHGDVGVVSRDELVIVFSNSGETDEIRALLPVLRAIGCRTVAVTGRPESALAKSCEIVVPVVVEREACPYNLAPTASTTAMLALGDALAITVMRARDFKHDDFARFHPAGTLGRRLLLRVSDVMRTGSELATVRQGATLIEAITAITRAGAGAACVLDDDGVMVGLIADGDIRRSLERGLEPKSTLVKDVMTRNPKHIVGDPLASEAFEIFRTLPVKIGEMPVLDETGRPLGMLMLKDLVRAGLG